MIDGLELRDTFITLFLPDHHLVIMDDQFKYSIPKGLYAILESNKDARSDAEIDHDIQNPKPVIDEKNIWFFWHSGYTNMYGYTQRNIPRLASSFLQARMGSPRRGSQPRLTAQCG